jgi:hypothetical protein
MSHSKSGQRKKRKAKGHNRGQRGSRNRAVEPRQYLSIRKLSERSQLARDHALHVLSAMRRDPNLSLARAAKLQGIKSETVKKYFPSALKKSNGKLQVTKGDRFAVTLYVPDVHGNPVPLVTHSSKERKQASEYLRDLGRYLHGKRDALSRWHGKKIAGVELVTAGRTLRAIEPSLSGFSLYRAFNSGAE